MNYSVSALETILSLIKPCPLVLMDASSMS